MAVLRLSKLSHLSYKLGQNYIGKLIVFVRLFEILKVLTNSSQRI